MLFTKNNDFVTDDDNEEKQVVDKKLKDGGGRTVPSPFVLSISAAVVAVLVSHSSMMLARHNMRA